jgi:hypothetical protein
MGKYQTKVMGSKNTVNKTHDLADFLRQMGEL